MCKKYVCEEYAQLLRVESVWRMCIGTFEIEGVLGVCTLWFFFFPVGMYMLLHSCLYVYVKESSISLI